MSRFDALDPSFDQEDGRNNKGMMSLARRMPFRDLVRYSLSVPIHLLDKNVWPKKIDFPDLIRGYYKEPEETSKKGLKDLIVSVADLKGQMPPLSDYSIKTNNIPQSYQGNSLENALSLAPQSEFVSPIDMPSQNEAEQQQKDAMNYIAELNRRSAPEQLQTNAPLSEEGALQTNDKSEQEQESLNAPENFINSQGQPKQLANGEADDFFQRLAGGNGHVGAQDKYSAGGLWDRFKNSEFSERLMDSFAGLASGQTPQESFSNAALQLRQGNSERAQRQQVLNVLQSKGYSDQEAQAIAQNPDLAMKIMNDTLSPVGLQEGYRILTPEEKAAQGLPNDMAFQVSTQTGKIEPLKGTQRTDGSGLDFNNALSKPESGYMYVQDENGIRAEPIPGGAADRKLKSDEEKRKIELVESEYKAEQFVGMVEELKQTIEKSPNTVGMLGYWESFIPGTDAAQFGHMLETVKSNIAIDTLKKMKRLAPNGASGFGNLSNVEFKALQNSIAALDQDLSAKQMKESLQTIIDTYRKANNATRMLLFGEGEITVELVREAYGLEAHKNEDKTQSGGQLEEPIEALPEGYAFVDKNNKGIWEIQTNG
ncbi:hypothetical protein [Bartonella bovis]|uniref:Uncharacterized protein n=1 Tax=Bartonella bovis m02 TaxID=1094492 RepID=N6VRT7_9HYPH|nr:hypothetical protein [Bartonella bovis]ENN93792.1 hypothetical protein m02_08090 [Bartonella bovis m02]